jgi:hypothetical protein
MNTGRINPILMLAFAGVFLSGCTINNQHSYHDVQINFQSQSTRTIGLAVHDQRTYIVASDRDPDFTGSTSGGIGKAFDVTTETGKPLASEMTEALTNALKSSGFLVKSVETFPHDSRSTLISRLKSTKSLRLLLLTLNEWKSDTLIKAGLLYDVTLEVFTKTGRLVGSKRLTGKDNLGAGFFNPSAHARKAVPAAFKAIMEELLNAPEISRPLTSR